MSWRDNCYKAQFPASFTLRLLKAPNLEGARLLAILQERSTFAPSAVCLPIRFALRCMVCSAFGLVTTVAHVLFEHEFGVRAIEIHASSHFVNPRDLFHAPEGFYRWHVCHTPSSLWRHLFLV